MFGIEVLTMLLGTGLLIGIVRIKRSSKKSTVLSPFDAIRDDN